MHHPHALASRHRPLVAGALVATLVAGLLPAAASGHGPGASFNPGSTDPAAATVAAVATKLSSADADLATPADLAAPADTAARPAAATRPPAAANPGPSQMYLDAQAHAGDGIRFAPGERVTIPFDPRPDDHWTVDGSAPRALPTGRLSGAEMAGVTDPPGAPPVTDPALDPGTGRSPVATPAAGGATGAGASPSALLVAPTVTTAATGLRREVYGFLPYWEVASSSTRLDFSVLSHVAYFSVGADRSGNLLKHDSSGNLTTGWGGWTSATMTGIINAAHRSRSRVTLTISVFAWTAGQRTLQATLLGSSAARLNLARQAVAAVRDRGADGINLDFEPLVSGQEDNFVALLRTFRAELNKVGSGYHLSYDTLGMPSNYPLEQSVAAGAADAIMIMGYDYRTASSGYAGSIDPLAGPAYDLGDTLATYTERVPAARLILGIPYYGRAWPTVSGSVNARTQVGSKFGSSAAVNYENAVVLAAKYGRHFDSREYAAWFAYRTTNCTTTYGCVTTWRQTYYDDATTLKARYDLVNRAGIRGVGIWALGYDGTRTELYKALADKFLNDTTPPVSGISVLAATTRDEGFVVHWNGKDDWNGVASYDVQVSVDGGPWTTWLAATTAQSDVWMGDDTHGYAFRVRARDGKGNLGAYTITSTYTATPKLAPGTGFGRVVAAQLNVRAAASTTAARQATVSAGAMFAITGGPVTADGCTWWEVTGPLYDWPPTGAVRNDVWVASACGGSTYMEAAQAPNATRVLAGIRSVAFGGGTAAQSVGADGAARATRSFSPNADGSRDLLAISWNNRRAFDSMTLNLLRTDGTLLEAIPLATTATGAREASWDGLVDGSAVADGPYLVQLIGVAAGVTYSWPSSRPATAVQAAATAITVDTVPPILGATGLSATRLSPNGDGRLDTVTVTGAATGGATHWALEVVPAGGAAPIATLAGTGATARATWDGATTGGAAAPDGSYVLDLRFLDDAGNSVTRRFAVVLDTLAPVLDGAATPAVISPNGDGADDASKLAWSSSEAALGILSVVHGTRTIVTWPIAGTAGAATWTGRDSHGVAVPDGHYTVRLDVRDAAGNRSTRSTTMVIDRSAGFLRWSASSFFPHDRDAVAAASTVSFRLARRATTSLAIVDATGTVVRRAWTVRVQAAGTWTWRWNGTTGTGTFAPRGRYVALLTVVGPYGTTELRRVVIVNAFVATPSSVTPAAGSTLAVAFRSTEPLASPPTATFGQAGRAAVAMKVSRLADGTYRAVVKVAPGAPGNAVIMIAGRDRDGHLNTTTLVVRVP